MPSPLAKAIRAAANDRGMTISELARVSRVPRSTLYKYLRDHRQLSTAHLFAIFEALGIGDAVIACITKELRAVFGGRWAVAEL